MAGELDDDADPWLDDEPTRGLPRPPEGEAAQRARKLIVVGGGRGGVGKTLLTVNLGVYLAQLGRKVILCDADPAGSNLHAMLGLEAPPLFPNADEPPPPMATSVPGLMLLPSSFDPMTSTPVRAARRSNWLAQVGRLDADYVIFNLGPAATPPALDLFLGSDLGLCVTAPEPLAVETTYRFCRSLFARSLRRALVKERYRLRLVERAAADLPPLASPKELVLALHKLDEHLGAIGARELARLAPRLVVGQTRLRSDLDLGPAMTAVAERFLGVNLDYVGHVEHDDAVWLTARRRQPLLIDSPTSKSARNIERVSRRVLALLATPASQPMRAVDAVTGLPYRPPPQGTPSYRPSGPPTLYEVLGVSRTAGDDEIRRAFKRQREIYRDGSLALASVLTAQKLQKEQARLEEAYATLLDPVRRRAYDLSTFPDSPPQTAAPARTISASEQAELAMLQAEIAREINAETHFSGPLLRKVREAQGIDIAEIAKRTKISMAHLAAIENETPEHLPASVYVQGFVGEIAKFLRLDPAQVQKTYMRRLRELRQSRS